MLKLFYTGSTSFNTSQNLASRSLGGYISNTAVPNGVNNSLFSPLSLMEFYKDKKTIEYIGLGLYLFFFDGEESYDNIDLKFKLLLSDENDEVNPEILENFKELCQYKIGLAPISGDSVNGYYLETVQPGAKPYYLTHDFQKLLWEEDITFENIDISDQKGVGVWLNRSFNPKLVKEKFGFESDYWINNDKLPNFDFIFDLKVNFEPTNNE